MEVRMRTVTKSYSYKSVDMIRKVSNDRVQTTNRKTLDAEVLHGNHIRTSCGVAARAKQLVVVGRNQEANRYGAETEEDNSAMYVSALSYQCSSRQWATYNR